MKRRKSILLWAKYYDNFVQRAECKCSDFLAAARVLQACLEGSSTLEGIKAILY